MSQVNLFSVTRHDSEWDGLYRADIQLMELQPSPVRKIAVNEQSFPYSKLTPFGVERGVKPYGIWLFD